MFTLNEHRKSVLQGRGMMMRSPIHIKGQRPPGLKGAMQPFQVLHTDNETDIIPVMGPMQGRTNANATEMEDREILSFRESVGVNDFQTEMADRMTAYEFRRRQDGSWSNFRPMAEQIYMGIKQVVQSVQNHLYLSGKMPPPPPDMLLSGLDFEIELRSIFSFGAKEKGNNLTRALAPFGELFPVQPELLDEIDFRSALRENMSQYHVADLLLSQDQVREKQMGRAQREGGGGKGPEDPVGKGTDKAVEDAAMQGASDVPQQAVLR